DHEDLLAAIRRQRVWPTREVRQREVWRDETAERLRPLPGRDAEEGRARIGIDRERAIERRRHVREIEDTALTQPRARGQRHAHRVVAQRALVQLPAQRLV